MTGVWATSVSSRAGRNDGCPPQTAGRPRDRPSLFGRAVWDVGTSAGGRVTRGTPEEEPVLPEA